MTPKTPGKDAKGPEWTTEHTVSRVTERNTDPGRERGEWNSPISKWENAHSLSQGGYYFILHSWLLTAHPTLKNGPR